MFYKLINLMDSYLKNEWDLLNGIGEEFDCVGFLEYKHKETLFRLKGFKWDNIFKNETIGVNSHIQVKFNDISLSDSSVSLNIIHNNGTEENIHSIKLFLNRFDNVPMLLVIDGIKVWTNPLG